MLDLRARLAVQEERVVLAEAKLAHKAAEARENAEHHAQVRVESRLPQCLFSPQK